MRVVASYSIKGGVGKTAAAVNLAYEAARTGGRVLLWDLDPQAAATFYLRVRPRVKGGAERLLARKDDVGAVVKGTDYEGLDLVPADFSLRNLDLLLDAYRRPTRRLARVLRPLADDYDLVVLDCPPGVSLSSESVFAAADVLLVPLVPTTLSVRTLDQLLGFVGEHDHRPAVAPFFSMVDRRKRLHRELVEDVQLARPETLSAQVPSCTDVERMGVHRAPVREFAPHSPAVAAYEWLWRELADRLRSAVRT